MATSQSKNSVVADWVQLLELLNKVWDLGLDLLRGCSRSAYELLSQVRFQRVDRASGLSWRSSVFLHVSW